MSASTTTAELRADPGAAGAFDAYRPSLRAWAWAHPEWWALALSAAAWLETFASISASGAAPAGMTGMAGMAMGPPAGGRAAPSGAATLGAWALMVAAMMLPLTIGPLRAVAERSLWRRRQRALVEYLAGFAGVWLVAGVALLGLRAALVALGWMPAQVPAWALASGLALAATWQLTPYKRRALRACHRTVPLAPSGWRALRDCVAYGARGALSCLVSCGPAMLALVLGGGSLVAMLAVSAVVLGECYALREHARASAAALALLALAALAL